MGKQTKKYLLIVTIGVILIFSLFWTEGFGIAPKYQYGKTVEQALNFWYQRGQSNIGLLKAISTIDISNNKKLVFYETTNHTLSVGLVMKKWNNKWVVVGQGGDVPFDNSTQQSANSKSNLSFQWYNLSEFGVTFGVIYDPNIETITVGGKDATLLNKNTNRYIWYYTDKSYLGNGDLKPILDVKAYSKSGNLIYSYYPQ
ncbi:hypothetical protein [Candidatus Clostridium radicumherbarum]|uniref:Lipoprotein n=1 Tax=Candidatus Clostridium radicumherbarum TaxID=3381662 RepID=A0ABW8TVB8_9CLOT